MKNHVTEGRYIHSNLTLGDLASCLIKLCEQLKLCGNVELIL